MDFLMYFWHVNQLFLLYLIGVMISVGIIKEYNLFSGFYGMLIKHIKSKRLLVSLISAVAGILPVPGRVVVSASVLDTLAVKERKQRSKFGLVDYLSTHHYYLWSPLEKTIIIPMAVLGLTYPQIIAYTWPLLVGFILYTIWYIYGVLKEEDIKINVSYEDKPFTLAGIPLLAGIGLLIAGIQPWAIFTVIPIIYIIGTKTWNIKKILSYINWKLIGIVSIVIALSTFLETNSKAILNILNNIAYMHNLTSIQGFVILSIIAWLISFLLGSSSKFAGIVAMLTSIFGLPYLTYFMALEFSAYLVSPCHKCIAIAKSYFSTSIGEFLHVIGGLIILILLIGVISLF